MFDDPRFLAFLRRRIQARRAAARARCGYQSEAVDRDAVVTLRCTHAWTLLLAEGWRAGIAAAKAPPSADAW